MEETEAQVLKITRCMAMTAAVAGRVSVHAALAAVLLVVITVLPVLAVSGPTRLSDPQATPTSATSDTTVTLAVTYRNSEGSPPDYVRVSVAGSTLAMTPSATSQDWKKGVGFEVSIKLPVGSWDTLFEAGDREKFTASVTGPTVTITRPPAPTPRPTTAPTPRPTGTPPPAGTPRPSVAPTAAPTAVPPASTPPTPAVGSPGAPTSTPTAVPGGASGGMTPGAPDASGAPGASAGASQTPEPNVAMAVPGAKKGGPGGPGETGSGSAGAQGRAGGPDDRTGAGDDTASGIGSTSFPGGAGSGTSLLAILTRILPTLVVTTGGVTMAMAFLTFGRRRRDQEPTGPDTVLGAAAARGSGLVASSGLVPAMTVAGAAAAASAVQAAVAVVPGFGDVEAHMPRWRRPSLIEARKADPLRSDAVSTKLTFEGETGAAVAGLERRLIRYRMVTLLSDPDEVRGVEIGVLDEGDEVVLMEKRGTYRRVLCPNGTEGWLHKMTLGDVVIDSPNERAGTWTSGDDGPAGGVFEAALRAYTERPNQFGDS